MMQRCLRRTPELDHRCYKLPAANEEPGDIARDGPLYRISDLDTA